MPYYPQIFTRSIFLLLCGSVCFAAPPSIPRTIPPPGIAIPAEEQSKLETACDALAKRLAQARQSEQATQLEGLLPDVEIYLKGVQFALQNGEFFDKREFAWASEELALANQRLDQLLQGNAPWTKQRGNLTRGFRSQLDNSVQPYGLVIPEKLDLNQTSPLIVWLHGRGDKVSEVKFLHDRQTSPGQVAPPWAIVLHPYGRYCNAFKFAGEVDVFESIRHVQEQYKIDPNRIILWGFSMGGAGCWHLGAHHPDRWAAVSPGAGFADTARYQNIQPENYPPTYEQTLWGLFDAPNYVRNLFNVPVVAYSGELDKQKQAADLMAEAYQGHGHELKHLIGPGVEHKYHPDTLKNLTNKLHALAEIGRIQFPKSVALQTRTLRYNRSFWVEALGLEEHWQDSRVDAQLLTNQRLAVTTKNVSGLKLVWPGEEAQGREIHIDSQVISVPDNAPVHATLILELYNDHWRVNDRFARGSAWVKKPGLQGPIDDVFMEPFLVVLPSGKCQNPQVQAWVEGELAHFQDRWRRLFRADLPTKQDKDITFEDQLKYHLILWGDRASNQLIAQTADRSPIAWNEKEITVGSQKYDAQTHVLSVIYPNPLLQSSSKYVVLNSGLTFREGHDRTNSLQNPKLPDWAVIDITTPANHLAPGKVVAADFFDEEWKFRPAQK